MAGQISFPVAPDEPTDVPCPVTCMTRREWAAWLDANMRLVDRRQRAITPCADCTIAHCEAMRKAGTCNGRPLEKAQPGPKIVAHPDPEVARRRARWRVAQRRFRGKLNGVAA